MSNDDGIFSTDAVGRRERPFLYPWNRKLRHLQGISLRNLNVASTASRSRGKTITDDDVPYNLNSPAKRFAQNEAKIMQHSRSFSDLTSPLRSSARSSHNATASLEAVGPGGARPGLGKMRRRSTLHWTGASPRARQQKLEDVAASRMADTWFSIHAGARESPLYISEIMERSMNPSFRFFDLDECGPAITRLDECKLRVWSKTDKMDDYIALIELDLSLASLQFVGRTMENFHHPLPQNCVLFHLSDGIYTSFTDMPVEDTGRTLFSETSKSGHIEPTSSYDALMRLANLDDCIQDALNTRQALETEITLLLSKIKNTKKPTEDSNAGEHKLTTTKQALSAERRQLRQLAKKREETHKSLDLRRASMTRGHQTQAKIGMPSESVQNSIGSLSAECLKSLELSNGQIRRICEDLLVIFPIEPLRNKTLQFSIRSIHLPNSAFDDTNRDEIAAALTMTARLVYLLSLYLSTPLPYPINLTTGDTFISDPISIALTQRQYPLHPTNVAYKFEYGVFLLNKNIEFLMTKVGLRMLDIRHTLPNLKYLLYVLTAGTGELPARKAGGVRGLSAGRFTPSISRRTSEESVFSNHGYSAKLAMEAKGRNGSIDVTGGTREKESGDQDDPFLGAARTKGLPYRNSLLRDAS